MTSLLFPAQLVVAAAAWWTTQSIGHAREDQEIAESGPVVSAAAAAAATLIVSGVGIMRTEDVIMTRQIYERIALKTVNGMLLAGTCSLAGEWMLDELGYIDREWLLFGRLAEGVRNDNQGS